jgi:hypothetical protein
MLDSRMDYAVRREADYLVVRLTGAPSEHEVRTMLRELQAQCAGTVGLLVEVKLATGLSLTSTKDLVSSFPSMGFPKDYRLAVLLLDDAASRSAEFAEDVAFNRGIALRVFREREKALHWLAAPAS